jgi:hypothetical protein
VLTPPPPCYRQPASLEQPELPEPADVPCRLPPVVPQLVQAKGATAIATAGGTAKRSLLHSLGVHHVLGSRDTQFVSDLAELGGADIVLNSLTSSGMVAGSLAGLRQAGRFVEISKRDIWSPARVAQGKAAAGLAA